MNGLFKCFCILNINWHFRNIRLSTTMHIILRCLSSRFHLSHLQNHFTDDFRLAPFNAWTISDKGRDQKPVLQSSQLERGMATIYLSSRKLKTHLHTSSTIKDPTMNYRMPLKIGWFYQRIVWALPWALPLFSQITQCTSFLLSPPWTTP